MTSTLADFNRQSGRQLATKMKLYLRYEGYVTVEIYTKVMGEKGRIKFVHVGSLTPEFVANHLKISKGENFKDLFVCGEKSLSVKLETEIDESSLLGLFSQVSTGIINSEEDFVGAID